MAKKQTSPIEILIENIKKNKALLIEKEELLKKTKEEKKEISDLLKDYQKDVQVLFKYVSDEEREKIEELGFDPRGTNSGLNPIAQFALDVITEKRQITNGDLYAAYIDEVPEGEEALTYSIFNVKIRPVFNTGLVNKQKVGDGKDTRDDLVLLGAE